MIKIEEIITIVYEAGKIALDIYSTEFSVNEKADNSPVTEADMAVDAFLHEKLAQYGYPIISEEREDDLARLNSEYVWIIDPLDGTIDFVKKNGEFTILVALVKNNKPIMGIVYAPANNELYYAEKGKGAYVMKDGLIDEIHVAPIDENKTSRIIVSPNHLREMEQQIAEEFNLQKIPIGSTGYKIAKVAAGEGDFFINSSDKTFEWDTCAGSIIIHEAGGMITDKAGKEIKYNQKEVRHLNGCIVSNTQRHKEIVDFIRSK